MPTPDTANQPPKLSAALKLLSEGCRIIAEACELLTNTLAAEADKQKDAKGEAQTSSAHTAGRVSYSPREMPELLGVKRGVYYKLVSKGLLKFTRIYDGGPRVHLTGHLEEFREYLRGREVRSERL